LPSIRKTGSYGSNASPIPPHANEALALIPNLVAAARAFGLSENQAYLAANQAVRKLSNDALKPLELMGVQLVEESKELLFTPTQIATELDISTLNTPRKVNTLLESLGLQEKREAGWEATPMGKPYSELLSTGKSHSNGTPILQLKWRSSVIDLIREEFKDF
jgi:hypothetical protein